MAHAGVRVNQKKPFYLVSVTADAVDEVELLQEVLGGEGAAQQALVCGNGFRGFGGGFLQQLDSSA
ncbi:MAG: hypothetical protein Q4E43_06395 [Akkermansia sp.]|nr:hypothetical protein [Akkermansia sp.]